MKRQEHPAKQTDFLAARISDCSSTRDKSPPPPGNDDDGGGGGANVTAEEESNLSAVQTPVTEEEAHTSTS